jgi:hypothetical protein
MGGKMSVILDLITGSIGPYLIAAVGALVAVGVAFFRGKASERAKHELKAARSYKTTTERMQDADASMGDDPAVLRDRMRERDPNQR